MKMYRYENMTKNCKKCIADIHFVSSKGCILCPRFNEINVPPLMNNIKIPVLNK